MLTKRRWGVEGRGEEVEKNGKERDRETERGMLLRQEKRKKKDQEEKKEGEARYRLKGRLTGWRQGS